MNPTEAMIQAGTSLPLLIKGLEFQIGETINDISWYSVPDGRSSGKTWKYFAANSNLVTWSYEDIVRFFQKEGYRLPMRPVKKEEGDMPTYKPEEDGRKMGHAFVAIARNGLPFAMILFWARKFARWDGYSDFDQANAYSDAFMQVVVDVQEAHKQLGGEG